MGRFAATDRLAGMPRFIAMRLLSGMTSARQDLQISFVMDECQHHSRTLNVRKGNIEGSVERSFYTGDPEADGQ